MTTKQFIVDQIANAGKSVFEAARKVPADKLEWKPLEQGRSALDLAQECADCPSWCIDVLKNRAYGGDDQSAQEAEYMEKKKRLSTLDACEAAFKENLAKLEPAIESFPESDMEQSITIPWGTFRFVDLMYVPAWNCHYHVGQINYIQTLYGDMTM